MVTKEELLDALWPGETMSESVLPRCIAAARRALGDNRGRGAFIQTLHRRGYRFVATVTEAPSAGHPAALAEARTPFVGREKPFARTRWHPRSSPYLYAGAEDLVRLGQGRIDGKGRKARRRRAPR